MVTKAHPKLLTRPIVLDNQSANLRVWNRGATIAIMLIPGTLPVRYWEIVPGDSFYIHSDFPPRILIGGTIEIEVLP